MPFFLVHIDSNSHATIKRLKDWETSQRADDVHKRTNALTKDVKAVLIDSNWDIEAAHKDLRRRGKVLALKKSSRIAAEGLLALAQHENISFNTWLLLCWGFFPITQRAESGIWFARN